MTPHGDVAPGACAQTTFSPSFWLGLSCLFVIASCAASPARPTGAALLGALAVALAAVVRVPPRLLLARLVPLVLFVLCTLLIVVLVPATEGAAKVSLPLCGLQVARQALSFVTALALKSALVLVFVTAMASRMTERALLEGLAGLRLPPKVVGL